ncbi:MAG: hypothetical protein IJP20_04875 [Clostridia bacterium]|nr:hypothetical protein [Clostridia bacterium]
MKKLTSLLLALVMLFTALTLSGCGMRPAFEKGHHYRFDHSPGGHKRLGITVEKNEYKMDEFTVKLYVGLHPYSLVDSIFAKEKEKFEILPDDINRTYVWGIMNSNTADDEDNETINDIYVIKEISFEESEASYKYYYTENIISGVNYNYSEDVLIPQDLFVGEESNTMYFVLCELEEGSEQPKLFTSISLHYSITENDIILIDNVFFRM